MSQDAETVARLESLAVDQRYRYERGDDPHPKQLQCAEALEAGITTIRSLSTRLAAAEAREAGLREALADVEPTFDYLAADIDLSMDDDAGEACTAHELDGAMCGHSICANTGCVAMRLRDIRAALQPGAPDADTANGETK